MTRLRGVPEDFHIVEVTDPKTIAFTREQNAEAWRNLLSVEDYVARELVLGKSKIVSSHPHKLAVFTLQANDASDTPLCSCEVLIRSAWRFSAADNTVERRDIKSACIGGVYTYKENRGRGLATIMIDKLVEMLKGEKYVGPDGFIFLYLEVGEFYARNGFKSFPVDLLEVSLTQSSSEYVDEPNTELVKFAEFKSLFAEYNEQFDKQTRAEVARDGICRISVNPSADYVDWFHLRAKFFSMHLFEEMERDPGLADKDWDLLKEMFQNSNPLYFGLKKVCPETGKTRGFIVWQYEYGYDQDLGLFRNYATVIKIHAHDQEENPDELKLGLIESMKRYLEAQHGVPLMSNFYKIVIWESEITSAVQKALMSRYECRLGLDNSSRSAIMCVDAAEDRKLKLGELIWANNTKLPWF